MLKIYHNPKCSTSRFVLEALRDAGHEVEIIEYLKTPPTRAEIKNLAAQTGLGLKGILRKRAEEYKALDLEAMDDEALLDAIEASPVLIERPIVVAGEKAWLCRPKETVFEVIKAL